MNIKLKNLDELERYTGGENPVTCPKCATRTDFIEISDVQQHKCTGCEYEFFQDFEEGYPIMGDYDENGDMK